MLPIPEPHRIISLFNHKGGVSKTTTCYALGWMLAEQGKRVIMIDADPQANLSGLVIGDDLEQHYVDNPGTDIRGALAPAYESRPQPIEAVDCLEVDGRPGLFLLPGHIGLSEYEVTLGIAQELSSSIQALRNLPGAFRFLADRLAERYDADFLLIDMNPSLGALNQNFLMSSHGFVVPTSPDYFSVMAIDSLTTVLPRWAAWGETASKSPMLSDANYPFLCPSVKFLGSVIQKFRPRYGEPTVGFQIWIDKINGAIDQKLFPALTACGMALPKLAYQEAGVADFCLAKISDFNTLVASAQSHRRPVFALSDEMTGHVGTVLEQDREKMAEFYENFREMAESIVELAK